MPDYVVNPEIQFLEAGSLLERIRSAAALGFHSQDFWRWQELDLDSLQNVVARAGVDIESFVVDWRTPLTDARFHGHYLKEWQGALRLAERLGTRKLIVVPGDVNPALSEEQHVDLISSAISAMATQAVDAGITILLEPVNTADHPGTWMDSTDRALKIIDAVAQPSLKLLCDVYHQAMTGEDLAQILRHRSHDIGYVQFADAPGRGEPTTGAIDWKSVCRLLTQAQCAPRVGLEFIPTGPTAPSLDRAIALLDGYW